MIMKNLLVLIVILCLTAERSWAQPELFPAKPWNATIKIIGEDSLPVSGASVSIAFATTPHVISSSDGKDWDKIQGVTDTNGLFIATHTDRSASLGIHIRKEGYYPTDVTREMGLPEQNVDNRNISLTLTLKKIGRPIAMYARKVRIEIPKTSEPIGFDLTVGDWIAPYGKGLHSDFYFENYRRWVDRKDFNSSIKVTFSLPSDGIEPISVSLDQGSELRLSANAPLDGYVSKVSKSLSHTHENGWQNDENKEQNYYFRVRTITDSQGNIRSALYGKIYGDFTLDPINSNTTWILFVYYLNPTPNDRNVEFDPKQNLIKNLKPDEGVDAP
jgi:hypothetical protein